MLMGEEIMSRADNFNYKMEEKVEEDLNKAKAIMEKSDFERMLIKNEEVLEKGCVKEPSVFDPQSQAEEFEEVKVKIEPKVLEDDPYPVELVTLTCQPDLDIKQDPESDEMEILQSINDNEGKARTFMANQLQTKMVTEPIEEDEKVQMENKEIKQQNEEVDLLEPSEKARKLVEMVKTSLQEKDKVAVPNIINRLQEKLILLLPAVPCQTIPEQVNLENRSFFNYVIRLSDQIRLCDFKLTDGLVSSTSAKLADRASKVLLPKSPARDPEVNSDQQKVLLNDSEILSLRADNEASLLNESEILSLPADNECKWKDCYQTYDSQGALVKHIENNHVQSQSSKEFICFWDNCPRKSKPFYKKGHLLLHMRSHSGEKPYKCGFQGCNKAFRQVRNLTVHQRGHTGEKPYQCQYSNCFKRFSTVYDKNDHQRLHYNPEFYACQVTGCLKKYNHPSNLWRHLKIHTVDEQLETKRKLIENKKKEGDFVLKKSSNSSDRNKHRRIHYNKEAYACRVTGCSKMYADLNSLRKHMENHIVDEELEVKQKSVKKEQMENDFIVYHL